LDHPGLEACEVDHEEDDVRTSLPGGHATVRYFGGAKAAAGARVESVAVSHGRTVEDLVSLLGASHGDALA